MPTCKSCGTPNEKGTFFCEKCGKLLEPAEQVSQRPAEPPATPVSERPAQPVFEKATATIQPQTAPAFCAKCGAQAPAGSSFCPSCGAKLTAAFSTAATATVAPSFSPPAAAAQVTAPATESRLIAEFSVQPFAVNMNLMVGMAGPLRTGKLSIYTDKIQFVPGKFNKVDMEQTIAMSDVVSAELCSVVLMPTGVKITTRGGESFTYQAGISGAREQIADAVKRQIATLSA
jgi:hypothetical protein